MQGKSDAYWTLILVLMRYLPVLGAASVLPQRWCTPGAFGYHSHDILDRAQRAVDRVLVTPQILLTEGAEGFTHQIDLLGTSKRHYAGFTAVAGGQRPNTSACWRLPLSRPVKGRAAFKVDARRRRTSSRRRRRGPRVAGTEDKMETRILGGRHGRCR